MAKLTLAKKIEKLVFLENEEPMTTSLRMVEEIQARQPADEKKIEHETVIRLIRRYQSEFLEFGFLRFEIGKNRGTSGRQTEFAILNEGHMLFLFTLMRNSKVVTAVKKDLVKGFFHLRKTVAKLVSQRTNQEWLDARASGKVVRLEETDIIKEFVEYATVQGSKNAGRYYSNITKMQNKTLFIIEQEFPNLREVLNQYQLGILKIADVVVSRAIEDGMGMAMNYKDIYRLAKERLEVFMSVVPKTPVPMLESSQRKEVLA